MFPPFESLVKGTKVNVNTTEELRAVEVYFLMNVECIDVLNSEELFVDYFELMIMDGSSA